MSHSLTFSNSKLATPAPKKALKKAAGPRQAKKPKDHAHGHKKEHDPGAEYRRAYLHLARASALLGVLPENGALSDLQRLHSICKAMVDGPSPKAAAECARALEHLCFASLASSAASTGALPRLEREQRRHFERDFERQQQHVDDAQNASSKSAGKRQPLKDDLLHLAQQSLATAGRMLQKESWHVTHECLRVTDALTKTLDQLS